MGDFWSLQIIKKEAVMKKRVWLLYLLSAVFIAGCGENAFEGQEDKSSTEARQFDISKNLDSGNYQAVLNDPNANATDYAAAAMIAAGLNPVDLVKQLNTTASTTAGTTSGDLSAVTKIEIHPENLKYLAEAENKLTTEIQSKCSGMTATTVTQECKDLNFQQTVTSLTTTITALAQIGQNNNISYTDSITGTPKTFNANDGISKDEATALASYLTTKYTGCAANCVTVDTGAAAPVDIVTVVAKDVATIAGTTGTNGALALSGLGGSELQTTLNNITTGTKGIDPGGNGVTSQDITTYLNTNFAK